MRPDPASAGGPSDAAAHLPRILLVLPSRTDRALIAKELAGRCEVREEADGESAWQVIVLDSAIRAVVCALDLPVLIGDGLLTRVRASRLARISGLPMLMIAGADDDLERLRLHGASGFIGRDAREDAWWPAIERVLSRPTAEAVVASYEEQVLSPVTGLYSRKYLELQAVQAMSQAMRHGGQVSVLVLGFDQASNVRERYGAEALLELEKRFAALLSGRVRMEDSLGHYVDGLLAIVSPGTPYVSCERFAERLRKAVAQATLVVRGVRLNLSVSVGVSNTPVDAVSSAGALIELAARRLRLAQQEGGDQVVGCGEAAVPQTPSLSVERAIDLINSGRERDVLPHLDALRERVLPLLRLLAGASSSPTGSERKEITEPARGTEDAGK